MTMLVTASRSFANFCFLGFRLKLFELRIMVNEASLIWHQKMVDFNYTGYIKRGYDGCVSLECFSKFIMAYRRIG